VNRKINGRSNRNKQWKIPDKIAAFQKWFKQHLPTSSNHFRLSPLEELLALRRGLAVELGDIIDDQN